MLARRETPPPKNTFPHGTRATWCWWGKMKLEKSILMWGQGQGLALGKRDVLPHVSVFNPPASHDSPRCAAMTALPPAPIGSPCAGAMPSKSQRIIAS